MYTPIFHSSQTAVSRVSFRYPAFTNTQRTGKTIGRIRRLFREPEGHPALVMYQLDFRPDLVKMAPDTIGTKA